MRVDPGLVVENVQLVAVREQQQLLQRGVERERRAQRHPEPFAAGHQPGRPVMRQQIGEAALLDEHALGRAGGTRRVDDVGGVVRAQRPEPLRVGQIRGGGSGRHRIGAVEHQIAHSRRNVDRLGGHHQDGLGIAQQEGDAFPRKCRIDRQVGGTGLPDGQDRHDHLGRPGQRQRHHRLGAGAEADQLPRQPVGRSVQLGETAPDRVAEDQRGRVRGAAHLLLEQQRERRDRHLPRGVVPAVHDPVAGGGVEHPNLVQVDVVATGQRVVQRGDQVRHREAEQPDDLVRVDRRDHVDGHADVVGAPVVDGHAERIVVPLARHDGADAVRGPFAVAAGGTALDVAVVEQRGEQRRVARRSHSPAAPPPTAHAHAPATRRADPASPPPRPRHQPPASAPAPATC